MPRQRPNQATETPQEEGHTKSYERTAGLWYNSQSETDIKKAVYNIKFELDGKKYIIRLWQNDYYVEGSNAPEYKGKVYDDAPKQVESPF